jgi:FkbM family methyltransferase
MTSIMIHRFLCQHPALYRFLLSFRKTFNAEKSVYLRLLHRGMNVLEIGANVGYFTKLFGAIVAPSGQVFAFEPITHTRDLLRRNLKGHSTNISILPYAATDHSGEETMFVPGEIHGQATLRSHHAAGWGVGHNVSEEQVSCRRIDDLDEIKSVPIINFMKVDAEGAELPALRGAETILLRDHPILHLEIEPTWMQSFGYGQIDLENYLRKLGYKYFYRYHRKLQRVESFATLAGVNVVCSQSPLL